MQWRRSYGRAANKRGVELCSPSRAAAWVRGRGAASSGEILKHFALSESTLRRRRTELRRLGIVFFEDGNRSLYAMRELAYHVPSTYRPREAISVGIGERPDGAENRAEKGARAALLVRSPPVP
jgi:hypothetical protein